MLRRTGFKSKRPPRPPMLEPRPISGGIAAQVGGVVAGRPKRARKKSTKAVEQQHKARLVLLGCMVCRRIHGPHDPGPVELHHYRGGGWGKGGYMTLMPLCHIHHRGNMGVHGLGTKGFAAHYGFDQIDLLNDALALIAEGK